MNQILNEVFDVDVVEVTENLPVIPLKSKTNIPLVDTIDEKHLKEDIQATREDLDTIIDLGKTALEQVLSIAGEGQHPRFYEAAAMIIKSINEAARERVELHLKVSEIRKNQSEVGQKPTINVDKAIFTGSTMELLKIINPRAAKKAAIETE